MKDICDIINQLVQLELRIAGSAEEQAYQRHFARIRESFKNLGYEYQAPVNEKYSETRTDIEATITGVNTENLVVKNVIKPVIYKNNALEQKGIVIVESEA